MELQEFRDYIKKVTSREDGSSWLTVLFVPAGCTSIAQPMDVGCQAPMKEAMRGSFNSYLMDTTSELLAQGKAPEDVRVDLCMSALKPLVPAFVYAGYKRLKDDPALVSSAWSKAGLLDTWDNALQLEADNLADSGKLWPGAVGAADVALADAEPDPSKVELDSDDDEQLATIKQGMQDLRAGAAASAATRAQEGSISAGPAGTQPAAPTATQAGKHAVYNAALAAIRPAVDAAKQSLASHRASSTSTRGRGRGKGGAGGGPRVEVEARVPRRRMRSRRAVRLTMMRVQRMRSAAAQLVRRCLMRGQ
jgi:hypothetical protein